jgi:hypothetical protein
MTKMIRRRAKRGTPPDSADGGMTRGLRSSGDRAAKTQTSLKRYQAGFRRTGSDSRFVFFTRANADDAFDVSHEDLAVADLAGTGCTDDCVNNLIRL